MKSRLWMYLYFVFRLLLVSCCGLLIFVHYYGHSNVRNYEKKYPPLIKATFDGNHGEVKRLLKSGADPNIRAFDNTVALHFLARNGEDTWSLKILNILLAYGARSRIADNNGYTPMHYVPTINSFKVRNEFYSGMIKNGGDINALTNLMDSGTSLDKKNKQRNSILDITVDNFDRTGVIDLLQNWGNFFTKDLIEQARKEAYDDGFRDIATEIKRYEQKRHTQLNDHGMTFLMTAIIKNHEEEFKKNVKKKKMVNTKSKDMFEQTALHLAIRCHRVDFVRQLLDAGAGVALSDWQGNTPLHIVGGLNATPIQKSCTQLLKVSGAKLNAKNKRQETILHYAIVMRDEAYIKYLVDNYPKELDMRATNKDGFTPVGLAKKLGLSSIVKMLAKVR